MGGTDLSENGAPVPPRDLHWAPATFREHGHDLVEHVARAWPLIRDGARRLLTSAEHEA